MPNHRSPNPQGHRAPKRPQPDSSGAVIPFPGAAVPERSDPPAPPDGLLPISVEIWSDFWAGDVAELVGPSDRYALRRWIEAVDERERIVATVRDNPTVEGSKGQPVLNPLGKRLDAWEAEIRKAEAQFGMTPRARADLGVQTGAMAMTAQRLNELAKGGAEGAASSQDQTGVVDSTAEEIPGFEQIT
jgi:P27 family predicted phage terminase small subunit